MHGEHITQSQSSIEQLSFIQPYSTTTTTNTNTTTIGNINSMTHQPAITSREIGLNGENNELALYLLNRIPAGIQVMHIIETSYCETECCFQYVRTTKTKTNYDSHTINTIEVYRGRRPNHIDDTINETYI